MSLKTKDFWERLFWTVALAAVSVGVVYVTNIDAPWGLAVLAGLQTIKNLVAQQVGDLPTSGFADADLDRVGEAVVVPEENADEVDWDKAFADEDDA